MANEEAPAPPRPRSNRSIIVILLLVIVAAASAAGWFAYYRTTPQYATTQFLEAAKRRDYDSLYAAVSMPDLLKRVVPNAGALRRIIETFPSAFPALSSYTVGSATTSGDEAVVKATLQPAGAASPTEVDVHLQRTAGRWMIDGNWLARLMARNGGGEMLKVLGPRLLLGF